MSKVQVIIAQVLMKGSYKISIRSKFINYDFEIKRNITVVRGKSGSGKTRLLEQIRQANQKNSPVTLSCAVKCLVVSGDDWIRTAEENPESIIFIDDDNEFIYSNEFASFLKGGPDNYFVLFARRDLHQLAYSMREICEIRNSGKFNTFFPVYPVSAPQMEESKFRPSLIVTEDGQSSHQFFKRLCDLDPFCCVPAKGNSNVASTLASLYDEGRVSERVLVFVDAAAFGAFANDLYEEASRGKCWIYLPESFEWMLLSSRMFQDCEDILGKLRQTWEHCDTSFASWERYYTRLIETLVSDASKSHDRLKSRVYSKSGLIICFTADCCHREECALVVRGNKVKLILNELLEYVDFGQLSSKVK